MGFVSRHARWLVCSGLFASAVVAIAQSRSNFPVDIVPGPAPQAVMADGRERLAYELHFTNFAPWAIELTGIEVFGKGPTPFAKYEGEPLEKLIVQGERLVAAEGDPGSGKKIRTVSEGHTVILFMDLTFDAAVRVPAELRHRFLFRFPGKNGADVERTVDGVMVSVVQSPTPVLRPPLSGSSWIAVNALFGSHRHAFNAVDGRLRIAERFAIDWTQLGPDGRLFHDSSASNSNYYGYGAAVLAVADAKVVDLKDGFPDVVGSSERSSRVITLENAMGNYVTLDLGQGCFAVYAHLQPGSIRVKLGAAVIAGQVLGKLGSSGNSDAPHLHFQLVDTNAPLASEGVPYELESFTQLGVVGDTGPLFDKGEAWRPSEKPAVRRKEFPLDGAVVTFP